MLKHKSLHLKGAVKDSLQNPLAYANVIAKPTDVSKTLKFEITNDDGKYRLELDKKDSYIISVSYMGYHTANFELIAIDNFNLVISIAIALEEDCTDKIDNP